mmetsp:Transcript_22699/g.58127  ORF Transcript_22699/g.58127 Transcript_22699/m.58127 type:complete len:536 (+) Transcript_22699:335-1942(+)
MTGIPAEADKENRLPNEGNQAEASETSNKQERTPVKPGLLDQSAGWLQELQEELTCSICLDLCIRPSTTACGHSFCRRCLKRALMSDRERRCPKCRIQLPDQPLAVHSALWNIIQMLFPGHAKEAASTQSPATPLPSNPFVRRRTRDFNGRSRPERMAWQNPHAHPPSYRVEVDEAPSFQIEVEDEVVLIEDGESEDELESMLNLAFWEAAGVDPPTGLLPGSAHRPGFVRDTGSPSDNAERPSLWSRIIERERSSGWDVELGLGVETPDLAAGLMDRMSNLTLVDQARQVAAAGDQEGSVRLVGSRHRAEERARWRAQRGIEGGVPERPRDSSHSVLDGILDGIASSSANALSRAGSLSAAELPVSRQGSRSGNIFAVRQASQQGSSARQMQPVGNAAQAAQESSSGRGPGAPTSAAAALGQGYRRRNPSREGRPVSLDGTRGPISELGVEAHPVRFPEEGGGSPEVIILSSDSDTPGSNNGGETASVFSPPPTRSARLYTLAQAQLHALQLEVAGTNREATEGRRRRSVRRHA